MKHRRNLWTSLIASSGMIILIIDAKTALNGAQEGIDLCLNTVIPALFPFVVISSVINQAFLGQQNNFLRPIGKLCGIPQGSESLLLLGLLGGYPIGAQSIEQAYCSGSIDKASAGRMLGFCSNAGPAFIFGMLGGLFTSKAVLWCLWGIHILSALVVGILLPNKTCTHCLLPERKSITFPETVENSVRTMTRVCAWVILFRVILTFCDRWFLWLLPKEFQAVFSGMLELSNGCIALYDLNDEGLKYILSAGLLSFGGICVTMQTVSVTRSVGIGYYFPGKLLQMLFSVLFAAISQYFLFDAEQQILIWWWPLLILFGGLLYLALYRTKKVVAIPG